MSSYDWDFGSVTTYAPALFNGLKVTLQLTLVVIIAGTAFGFPLGLLLRTPLRPVRWLVVLAVDVVRSLPVLVTILMAYYILPELSGYHSMPSFLIASLALSVNLAAFVADVVRGAVATVPREHVEAAAAIGLDRLQILRRVVVPHILQTTLPTFALLYIAMLKLTSLASCIAVVELTHAADLIRSKTFRSLETWTVVGAIYVVLVLPFSLLARRLELRNGVDRFSG